MKTPLLQLQADLVAKFLPSYLEKHPEAENKASVRVLRKFAGLPEKGEVPDKGDAPRKKKYRRYK